MLYSVHSSRTLSVKRPINTALSYGNSGAASGVPSLGYHRDNHTNQMEHTRISKLRQRPHLLSTLSPIPFTPLSVPWRRPIADPALFGHQLEVDQHVATRIRNALCVEHANYSSPVQLQQGSESNSGALQVLTGVTSSPCHNNCNKHLLELFIISRHLDRSSLRSLCYIIFQIETLKIHNEHQMYPTSPLPTSSP